MTEEVKKKKSRPKSEVVKGSAIEGEKKHHRSHKTENGDEKRETKRSHSRKDKSSHVKKTEGADNSALVNELETAKKELAAAQQDHKQTVDHLEERLNKLTKENEELQSKLDQKKDDSSSSSSGEVDQLKSQLSALESEKTQVASQLEEKSNAFAQLEQTVQDLRGQLDNFKSEKDKELSSLNETVKSLQHKLTSLEKENQELKDAASKPKGVSFGQTHPANNPVSPRFNDTNMPAWKLRELEKQKEAEEQRERESRAKLQKVKSLRAVSSEIENPNFKDPLEKRQPVSFHAAAEEKEDKPVADNMTEQEKIEAELARMNRTLKRGGIQL
jgi:uncharacterized phage infection (PIP) family protein YhgE